MHQYKLVCPSYLFYIAQKSEICEKCLDGHYWHPIVEKCHKNSRAAGALLALEAYAHRAMKIYDNIDVFHVPSSFMGSKLAQGGIDPQKIKHLFYTINIDDYPYSPDFDDYFIYYGRLSKEKGLLTLLKAMQGFNKSRLLIVGDGPQRAELEKFVADKELGNVEFLGFKAKEDLRGLVEKAKFVVLPSECYDNSPLTIYEALSMGKASIGSRIGGIPELIDHERNGLLFEPGNSEELREKMEYLLARPELIREFSKEGRQKAEREFTARAAFPKNE